MNNNKKKKRNRKLTSKVSLLLTDSGIIKIRCHLCNSRQKKKNDERVDSGLGLIFYAVAHK